MFNCLSTYICPSVIYLVRSGVGCIMSEQTKKSKFKIFFFFLVNQCSRIDLSLKQDRWIGEMIWESITIIRQCYNQNLCNRAFPPFNSSSTLINCFQISTHIPTIQCLPGTSWQAAETCTVAISCLRQANCFRKLLRLLQRTQNTPDKQQSLDFQIYLEAM